MEETESLIPVLVIRVFNATTEEIERWVETGKHCEVYNMCNGKKLLVGLRGAPNGLLRALYRIKQKYYKDTNATYTCTFKEIPI